MRQYGAMFPRTALVTGGASGIGAAIVELLETEGVDVEVLDLRNGFVRSVAPQLVARGIRLNAVAPGIADTPIIGAEARERFLREGFPLLRAEEVAHAVLLAARSEQTGQVWAVQPGRAPEPFRFP